MTALTPRQQFVTIDGIDLSVCRFGKGLPIVCLTAVGHDAYDFSHLAERLGSKYEFLCIEWPGHGSSSADKAPASAARYAELVEGVLREMCIRDPIVIGNSIGGAAGILYSSRHPVRALVLCDSGGLLAVNARVAKFCRWFSRFFAAGARGAWWFKTAFHLYYRLVLPSRSAVSQRKRIVTNAYKIAPMLAEAWRSFGEPTADIRATAQSLTVPIWVAWAKDDRVLPLTACRPAIDRMQNVAIDVFAGGHSPFLEQPDQFAPKLERFLARMATSPEKTGPSTLNAA
jgi:pimeloyl-ACP methyl ester carboxylesterase